MHNVAGYLQVVQLYWGLALVIFLPELGPTLGQVGATGSIMSTVAELADGAPFDSKSLT